MEVIALNRFDLKPVHILGKNQLQNNLLATYIEKQTQFTCKTWDIDSLDEQAIRSLKINLLLLDSSDLEIKSLSSIINSLASIQPEIKIALFNITPSSEEELAALPPVKGIFYSDISEIKLAEGIKAVIDGELWLSRRLISKFYTNKNQAIKKDNKDLGLTEREIQIIKMISQGARNKEIAQNLCLSGHTIKTHIYHIYKKIKVTNRTQAAYWAQQNLVSEY